MKLISRAIPLLMATSICLGAATVAAPQANAVTGCNVWANTDLRAYAQCSGGRGEMRAGAACAFRGFFWGSRYGQWVPAGRVSIADCGFPSQIDKRNGRPVVWYETR